MSIFGKKLKNSIFIFEKFSGKNNISLPDNIFIPLVRL